MSRALVESHLAYADDIVLFIKANVKSFQSIKEILDEFSIFSRLKINASKSKLVFSKSVENYEELVEIMGMETSSLLFVYLGLPITGKDTTTDDYMPL